MKQLSSTIVKTSNWAVLQAYLLKCGFGFPNTIQVIAHIFSTYNHYGYPLDRKAIGRFCNNLIGTSAAADHHGEVSWLLWICKELSIKIKADVGRAVERMGSPTCTLILLDLQNDGLLQHKLKVDALKQFAVADALTGPEWLLAYEAGRREWLGVDNDQFISNHRYFGPLNAAGVGFYDETKRLAPIFEYSDGAAKELDDKVNFDSDERIDGSFKFDEMDEEYFDSTDKDDSEETGDF